MRLGLSLVVVDRILKITSKFHPARYDQKLDRMVPTEENIDVIEWVPDPAEFIYNAIAPAEVDQVIFDDEDSKHALVVVPDNKTISCHWSSWSKRSFGSSFDWLPHRYQIC